MELYCWLLGILVFVSMVTNYVSTLGRCTIILTRYYQLSHEILVNVIVIEPEGDVKKNIARDRRSRAMFFLTSP